MGACSQGLGEKEESRTIDIEVSLDISLLITDPKSHLIFLS
jgi:hypothetical protein